MSQRLFILRPEPGASQTLARAEALGLDAVCHPLFETVAVDWDAPDSAKFTAVMMTSANAALLGGASLALYRHLPVFAVGDATAAAATAAGFLSVVSGEKDIARLLAHIATLGKHRLLHLSGEDVTAFDPIGIEIERRIVYAAHSLAPSPELQEALAAGGIALIHSPRAAARLAELVDLRTNLSLVAISAAAAEAAGAGWARVAVAAHPRDGAMLERAAELCRADEIGAD
jgi:uroporphyrinogen-III synthase